MNYFALSESPARDLIAIVLAGRDIRYDSR